MPIGRLSIRPTAGNPLHHLWCNNGSWWCHYTLHFEGRKRRIRRSLGTKSLEDAIRRRNELFARIEREGEPVPERRRRPPDDESEDVLGYREAELGLLARSQWLSRADCLDKIRLTKAAAACRREAEAIPAYWEENRP